MSNLTAIEVHFSYNVLGPRKGNRFMHSARVCAFDMSYGRSLYKELSRRSCDIAMKH